MVSVFYFTRERASLEAKTIYLCSYPDTYNSTSSLKYVEANSSIFLLRELKEIKLLKCVTTMKKIHIKNNC